ncbi:hypothetical protein AB0I28_19990 [Phytomonospora sp. NPDC050363]|uniref:hypothetical protein n=1 Tax=Phytomonospora sp. NPDC050363 TaxID=3155642 RepID=UPI003403A8CB
MNVRRRHPIPPEISALSGDPDYLDVFTLTAPDPARWSPAEWARAAFEDVAGRGGQFIWRALLALRLDRRAPGDIAGWAVAGSGEGWIRLVAAGPLATGHLLVHVDGDEVSLATSLTYRNRVGRWVWSALAPVHRRVADGLLTDTAAILARRVGDHTPSPE